jgi:exodeoxyribonuclease VII large subunit
MDIKIFTVSEISRQIKLLLEDSFPALWVEGEISNFRPHHSGHLYFTLKDSEAQISCVMWRSRAAGLALQAQDGLHVRAYGTIRLYEKAGRYQLDLIRIEEAGLGDLQLQFEMLKQKLAEEGLFENAHKKSLPRFPRSVGVITSPTGAAIRDILSVASRRSPSTSLFIRGVNVQGSGAALEIAEAINFFNRFYPVDLLIVGRGGGSLEDLWAFNEEAVARAIYSSEIPVVSAVGHEIDFTIADFVADLRAPTPSAAVEMTLTDDRELQNWLIETRQLIQSKIADRLGRKRQEVLAVKNGYAMRRPADILQQYIWQIEEITRRLFYSALTHERSQKEKIFNLKKHLSSLNPANVLNRGFALVYKDGNIVSSEKAVAINDEILVKLKDGSLKSQILGKSHG